MKIHLSGPLVLTVWLCLFVMKSAAAPSPERASLPDFDRRAGGAAAAAAGERQASVAELRAEVAGAGIDFNEVVGGPKWVRSRDSYLSGPGGEGQGISAGVAAGYATNDPHRAVKAFVQEHQVLFGYGPDVLASARVYRDYVTPHNGMKTTWWQQELDGIEVYEAVLAAHTTKAGELIGIASQFMADPSAAADAGATASATRSQPVITAQQAVVNAAGSLAEPVDGAGVKALGSGPTGQEQRQQFTAGPFNQAIETRLVWLPMNPTQMRLCWEVTLTSRARGETYRLLVDAQTGEVQVRRCLTVYLSEATYRVYTSDSPSPFSPGWSTPNSGQPALTSRVLVTWSALDTTASPNGWIDDGVNETRGNNVDAHTDRDGNDVPDLPRPQGSPFRVFDCPMDLTQSPGTYTNAAVVQLFYWCNFMHDKLYELGFTEAAGNFQNNNFGRGGVGNDALQADAQDGSGYNNANFTPTPDGTPPRIQMYIFNGPTPNRDGDFDAEVVLHEYTHGLSERLVGGGVGISALQTGGMGEGWSDWYALAVLSESGDDVNGVYACGGYVTYQLSGMTQNYYFGIRRYPYCTDMTKNPLTFKDIDPAQASSHSGIPRSPIIGNEADEVHNMGEVWCMTLREARANLVNKYGWAAGNPLIMQLVTDGMKLSPANPNFLQARDAIVQADLVDTGGANQHELWAAFAKRGMGFSATSPSSSTTTGLHEAYDIPDALRISPTAGFASSGPVGGPFSPDSITLTLTNAGSNPLSWTLVNTATWLNVLPASGTLNPGGPAASVTASLTASANSLPMGVYTSTVWFTNLNDLVVQGRQFTLRVGQPDYYTELFDTTANDMAFKTFTFTPDGSANFYSVCRQPAAAFPTDPTGGTLLSLTDDSYSPVTLSGGNTVAIYGTRSGVLYVGSNGYLTMDSGDTTYTESLSAHFSLSRVSALFDDLNPGAGGTISWKQLSDRVVVTYQNVPEYGTTDMNSFQMELFYDGRIRLTCLEIDATDGLAGLSAGMGVPVNFQESDFSTYGVCALLSLQLPASATEGSGVLTNAGTVWISSVLPTDFPVSLTSSVPTRLTVPASTTITAGQLHSAFNLNVVDNSMHDGDQTVTVTAGAPGFGNASASMLIIDDDVPPQILMQPSGQAALVGNLASFSVTATGKAPLGYFWRRNGTPIAGANASSYTTNNVQLADSGSQFSCLVSNAYGSVLSSNALLTVMTGAVDLITFDDLPDTTSGLDVPAGYHGLTWNNFSELNGLAFPTPSGYQYGVVSASNVVFNLFGGPASMTMDSPFMLVSAYLTAAWTPNLQVRVMGYVEGVLTYDQTYTLSMTVPTLVTFNYGGVTEVDFSTSDNFVMDNVAIAVGPFGIPAGIVMQPTDQTVMVGGTATFSVTAGGSLPLAYQWNFDGMNLSGATNTSLTLTNVQVSQAGNYTVLVTNTLGSVLSSNAVLTVVSPGSCAPVPSGLVSWWPGEGDANDIVSTNNGVLQGAISFAAGEVGQAFVFDGSSTSVQVPASSNLNVGLAGGFTLETWIKPVDIYDHIVENLFEWNNGSGSIGVHVSVSVGAFGDLYANIIDTTGGYHAIDSVGGIVATNVLQHVALTYDKTTGVAVLYLNGLAVTNQNLGSFTPQTSYDLYFGKRPSGPFTGSYFNGLMDEISIYNRALSSNEVASIYDAGSNGKCVNLLPPVPVITGFSPISGPMSISVTISGTNFSPVLSNNIVYFGAVRAVVTAASVTNLVVTVPAGATYAPITETVGGLVACADTAFEPTFLGDGSNISPSSFAPRVDLAGGSGSYLTVIADLDGDGKPDLVVANGYDNNISLFRNISTNDPLTINSFAPRVDLPSFGGGVGGLTLADVDGDGKLDLVVSAYSDNQVLVYRNISTVGTLTADSFAAPVAFNVGNYPVAVRVRDLDGDGRPDIACVNYGDNTISILKNIGTAGSLTTNSFAAQVVFATGPHPFDLVIADLDGDGKPDLAQVNYTPSFLSVFRNVSVQGVIDTNSFAARVDFAASGEGDSIVAGDVDGDGKVDLVAGWAAGSAIAVYRNLSNPGLLDTNSFAPEVDFPVPGWTRSVGLGDLNGDGKPDISLTCEVDSYMCVYQNLSTPGSFTNTSLAGRVDYGAGWNPHGVAIGDLDGDGRPDVVFGNTYDNTISIYQNVVPFGNAPPFITIQPTDQTVVAGGTASFGVTASGMSPLSYQWNFNGTNILGATNTTLILTNVQVSQAGNYTVLVTNLYGSILSSNAVLTVTLDHFAWNPIPSPRFVNTPFAVTLRAQNPTNGIFTNFTGTAILGTTNGIAVTPSVSGNFVQGVWTGAVVISQTASNLVLQADDGLGHFGLANPINVVSLPSLGMLHSGNIALYMWPVGYSGFVLETSGSLAPATWVVVPYSPIQIGDQYMLPLDMTGTNGYYRLRFPGP